MQLQVLDRDALGVERAHHLGQLRLAALQADGDGARRAAGPLAEAAEHRRHALAVVGLARDRLDRRAADFGLQLGRRALGDDVAVVDDPDPVGERVGLLQVLGGEEDGDAVVGGEARDLVPERGAALDVEAGRRLVEEEDARPVGEREREVEPALHPARVAADLAVGGVGEADPLEQFAAALVALGLAEAVQGGLQAHVLAAGQQRVERGLLQGGADRGAHLRPFLDDVEAGDAGGAGGGREEGGQHQHRRRLAGAVGAEEAVDLALGDLRGRCRRPPAARS